ncbi:hypothetical protein PVOR_01635 [Paenibacillus vortex V453]|uniref:Uncharacterized protein n=1 Tax=Paenibacillus vortex V453 TaxID=715225 RepID=A0A2R9T2M4_9BACL|nr:hypothetical protein [Paenibacillus vortex]EFU43872.1 hypothetical protein PVOR_01635 [Paenibacillus vortex V453]
MKVSELIAVLQTLQQDATIKVVIPVPGREHLGGGYLKEISEISEAYDQDTNRLNYGIVITEYQPD